MISLLIRIQIKCLQEHCGLFMIWGFSFCVVFVCCLDFLALRINLGGLEQHLSG